MHELGIMGEVVRIAEKTMAENKLTHVDTIVLQVGELAEIVPEYLEFCFQATTYKTSIEGAKLELEMVPGIVRCHNCGQSFNVVKNEGKCPRCEGSDYDILSGREFLVKQIIAN